MAPRLRRAPPTGSVRSYHALVRLEESLWRLPLPERIERSLERALAEPFGTSQAGRLRTRLKGAAR